VQTPATINLKLYTLNVTPFVAITPKERLIIIAPIFIAYK